MPRKKKVVEGPTPPVGESPSVKISKIPAKTPYRDKTKISEMTPEERKAAFKLLKPARERTDPNELPTWVCHAIIKHEYEGMTWGEVAKYFKKSEGSVKKWRASPAAWTFRNLLVEAMKDPVLAAQTITRAKALDIAFDNLAVRDAAREAGLVSEWAKQSRFLAESVGLGPAKKAEDKPTTLTINIQGGSLSAEIPMGESSAEKVMEAEIIPE